MTTEFYLGMVIGQGLNVLLALIIIKAWGEK